MNENSKRNTQQNRQWKKTCRQLKQAFEAWDELNSREPELSPDEKQLKEVKALLKDLKGQIEALSDPSGTLSSKSKR